MSVKHVNIVVGGFVVVVISVVGIVSVIRVVAFSVCIVSVADIFIVEVLSCVVVEDIVPVEIELSFVSSVDPWVVLIICVLCSC